MTEYRAPACRSEALLRSALSFLRLARHTGTITEAAGHAARLNEEQTGAKAAGDNKRGVGGGLEQVQSELMLWS
ncbi:hypothetical protein CesoFtcFv8_016557 [Champsocephalus esox]|uniref:Uncharacterized protein n=1 Tax=Champsocephalus esox TaxID=159716 RepID=A0AAN8BNK8_9TELE|nr:hypothetical protein CesoFtcFv8_016557 [Champsocephalus esox]